jgi:hypothetical protein
MNTTIEAKIEGPVQHDGVRSVRLTPRDKALLHALATARYLSSGQLQRLFFKGRTEAACRGRLFLLAGIGRKVDMQPCIRRLFFRTFEGNLVPVWAPTPHGYGIVQNRMGVALKVPAHDVGAMFLEHTITLNDLFVSLVEAIGPGLLGQTRAFRWIPSDSSRLPWRDYDIKRSLRVEHLTQPDAILELPASKLRVFIECEMGTQCLRSANPEKTGTTQRKLEQYANFLFAREARGLERAITYYRRRFLDDWAAEVLFLVQTPVRQRSVRDLVTARNDKSEWKVPTQALLLEEAAARYRAAIGKPVPAETKPPRRGILLSIDDCDQIQRFRDSACGNIQHVRHDIRDGRPVQKPEYPRNTAVIDELIKRIHTSPILDLPDAKE